ncbi:MAG: phytoene desaturase [Saprospiraceae bacterium]|nr:phytoene desaturase [Candidatus Vicinibacter affinis]MBK6822021.1 phytoene desaturase [Candidatus Vicinibacter affinis]MBK8641339.1 phytoene desaturase [Candidatus Vicinibacter affinis]
MSNNKIAVIGSGIAGMAAAIDLVSKGYHVEVFEKNSSHGGRGRAFAEQGFVFDMGPSWYWMPEVFEDFFKKHHEDLKDYFQLYRLDPSYRIFFQDRIIDAPAKMEETLKIFEEVEKGSSVFLQKFLDEAKYKYEVGMKEFVRKPALSVFEYLDKRILRSVLKLQMLKSIERVINKGVKNPNLRSWLSFPVLFLGAKPSETPALYSLMNYADLVLGTWFPKGGMIKLFDAFYQLALKKGVVFHFNAPVRKINIENNRVNSIILDDDSKEFDFVVAAADYHHVEQSLLDKPYRQYSERYWEKRAMAPGSLIFYVGLNIKAPNLLHHSLFFDADFETHADDIYVHKKWPKDPLFYVCTSSKTDPDVAPPGCENIFILMPIAAGIEDSQELREQYFEIIMSRMAEKCGLDLRPHIIYKKSYCTDNFISDYNSFKGNAYGLSNILRQTSLLKPRIRHKKVKNLYFAGQLSHPGPGLPPSMISGEIAAQLIHEKIKNQ